MTNRTSLRVRDLLLAVQDLTGMMRDRIRGVSLNLRLPSRYDDGAAPLKFGNFTGLYRASSKPLRVTHCLQYMAHTRDFGLFV